MSTSGSTPPVWTVLKAQLRADPRKAAVLGVLIVVMLGVYARFMFRSSGPSTAEAQAAPVSVSNSAETPDDEESSASSTDSAERVALPRPLLRELPVDPFAVIEEPAPADAARADGEKPVEVITPDADATVREEAKSLVLQSTLYGDSPLACINGQLLRPGQQIAGFIVERVGAKRVVLRRDGVQVALTLK